jgi:C1A family cysteine protease
MPTMMKQQQTAPNGRRAAMAETPRRFGWKPDIPDHRDLMYAAPRAMLKELPPSTDLRAQCPKVYDQADLGSCTANAIAGAIEFDRMKQKLKDFVPSRLFIYYNERAAEGTIDEDSGAYIRDGIRSVSHQGDCPETEWPYNVDRFADKPSAKCYKDALKYKAVSYQRVRRTLSEMKGCLASGFPFVFGVSVYESFISRAAEQTGDIPMPASGEPGANPDGSPAGHAMLCVGYDDAGQCFRLRNSWSEDWGDKGYGTIPYAYLLDENLSDDFWTIRIVK